MDDGQRVRIFRPDRRDVLRVIHGKPQERTRFQGLSPNRQRADDVRHAARVLPLLPDPARPVVENALADFGRLALDHAVQAGPDFLRREDISRKPVLNVDIAPSPPVVPGRIPRPRSRRRHGRGSPVRGSTAFRAVRSSSGPGQNMCSRNSGCSRHPSSTRNATSPASRYRSGVPDSRRSGAG